MWRRDEQALGELPRVEPLDDRATSSRSRLLRPVRAADEVEHVVDAGGADADRDARPRRRRDALPRHRPAPVGGAQPDAGRLPGLSPRSTASRRPTTFQTTPGIPSGNGVPAGLRAANQARAAAVEPRGSSPASSSSTPVSAGVVSPSSAGATAWRRRPRASTAESSRISCASSASKDGSSLSRKRRTSPQRPALVDGHAAELVADAVRREDLAPGPRAGEVVAGRRAEHADVVAAARQHGVVVDLAEPGAPEVQARAARRPVVVADPVADDERVGIEQERAPALEPDRRAEHADRLAPQLVGPAPESASRSSCARDSACVHARLLAWREGREPALGVATPSDLGSSAGSQSAGIGGRRGRCQPVASRAPTRDTRQEGSDHDQRPRASRRSPLRPRP